MFFLFPFYTSSCLLWFFLNIIYSEQADIALSA
ncbi:hypothetical protein J2787_004633 [Chryseobacterium rhizosphaerae]|uniref:Uncharacterized protein n=1 Tax=Chryseobacterium rhizosphaerae TaxID=395937 RepID=A0AAE4C5Z5_9FLAO|nr:hypothetical protein [Chryseobacterium rhizosphaerae]